MNRRSFLAALAGGAAGLLLPEPSRVRRAYSFLWTNPLARPQYLVPDLFASFNGVPFPPPRQIIGVAVSDSVPIDGGQLAYVELRVGPERYGFQGFVRVTR